MNIKKRLGPSLIIVVVTVLCILLGRPSRVLFFLALAIASSYELQTVLTQAEYPSSKCLLIFYIALQAVLCWMDCPAGWMIVLFFGAVFAAIFWGILDPRKGEKFVMTELFLLVWPFALYAVILYAAASEEWMMTMALGILGTWACDCMALVGGGLFGKHPLAPAVSPHKTWEGTLIGAASSLVVGMLIAAVFGWNFWMCALTACIASSFGQIGDLAASLLKRFTGVKDYSHFIPEHGGIMDRMDSLLFSIPAAYLCVKVFVQGAW